MNRERRLDLARLAVHVELEIGFMAPVIAAFVFIAHPGFSGGGIYATPPSVQLTPWIGVVGTVVGLVWLVRLSRPDPEPGERDWRYRDF
jgi:hypothetical protein